VLLLLIAPCRSNISKFKGQSNCSVRSSILSQVAYDVDTINEMIKYIVAAPTSCERVVYDIDHWGHLGVDYDGVFYKWGGKPQLTQQYLSGVLINQLFFPLVDEKRGRNLASECWTSCTQKAKVYLVQPSGATTNDLPTTSQLDAIWNNVNRFYLQTSGGLQDLEFIVHSTIMETDMFHMSCDTNINTWKLADSIVKQAGDREEDYDRLIFLFPRCQSMAPGLGAVLGKQIWVNGEFSDSEFMSAVIAHEIGKLAFRQKFGLQLMVCRTHEWRSTCKF